MAPELGAMTVATQPLGDAFELALSLRAGVPLTRPGLSIEGTSARMSPPPVDAQLGVRLGWAIFL